MKEVAAKARLQAAIHSSFVYFFSELNMGKRFYWYEKATRIIENPFMKFKSVSKT